MLLKKWIVNALILCGALGFGATAIAQQGLKSQRPDFLIGFAAANDFWTLQDAQKFSEVAAREFNLITPENQMKWAIIHPESDVYQFAAADAHLAFARKNQMKVHGHVLIWHSQIPAWMLEKNWARNELIDAMYSHIDRVMGHFKNGVYMWDVVNEAFNEDGSMRPSFWQKNLGDSHLPLAFTRARLADPHAKLLYNDYNIETLNRKSDAVYKMVQAFRKNGVPIDAIGMQMHITSGGIDMTSFQQNMKRLANLGLDIYITEMDVRIPKNAQEAGLLDQAQVYAQVLKACLAQPACKGLQTWGMSDKYSWVPGFYKGFGSALLFDENYQPKPAYYAVEHVLKSTQ